MIWRYGVFTLVLLQANPLPMTERGATSHGAGARRAELVGGGVRSSGRNEGNHKWSVSQNDRVPSAASLRNLAKVGNFFTELVLGKVSSVFP